MNRTGLVIPMMMASNDHGRENGKAGLFVLVAGYRILVTGDEVVVHDGTKVMTTAQVGGLEKFLVERHGHIRVAWGKLPDFEVVYLFDTRDSFGYAINLHAPDLSEWGYAPFPPRRDGHP